MTRPAIRPASSIEINNIVANTIEVGELAALGSSNGSGIGFYGVAPMNQGQALTVPASTGVADLAAIALPDAADLPSAIALVNALKGDRNGAVQDLVNSVKFTTNNNGASLDEIRGALGQTLGVGLIDISP